MTDKGKTREQLIHQLVQMRQRNAELEVVEARHKKTAEWLKFLSPAVEQITEGIAVSDLDGNLLFVNNAFAAMHGYTQKELVGKHLSLFHAPEQMPAVEEANQQVQRTGEFSGEIWHARRDGEVFPSLMQNSLIRDDAGRPIGMITTVRDLTEYKQTEEKLRERTHELSKRAKELNCLYEVSNLMAESDWSMDEIFQGIVYLIQASWRHPDITGARIVFEERQFKTDNFKETAWKQSSDINVCGRKAGSVEVYHLQEKPAVREDPFLKEEWDLIHALGRELSRFAERKRAEETIKELAYKDEVTGLPNRRVFNDRLSLEIAHTERNQQKLGVMLLDLDHFKSVNDELGHSMGDKLLQAVGDLLTSLLRKSDTVARLGGDEFMLLLPEMDRSETAGKIAMRIMEAFRKPFVLNSQKVHITTSLGIVVYPDDGEDGDILIRNADIAMYHAKKEGRNNYQRYAPSMNAEQQPR